MSSIAKRNIIVGGSTEGGKAAVTKIVHPPEATPGAYQGYPDLNNTDSVQLHYALNNVATGETILQYNNANVRGFVHWIWPSILYPIMAQHKADDPTSSPNLMPVQTNNQVEASILQRSVGSMRQVYKSVTYDNITPDIRKGGQFFVAQFRGNVQVIDTFSSGIVMDALSPYKNAKDWHDCLHKMAKDSFAHVGKSNPNAPWVENIKGIQIMKIGKVITDASSVSMASPKSVAMPGREGAFVVTKPSQPDLPYKQVPQASSNNGDQVNNLYVCAYEDVDPTGALYLKPITTDGTGDPAKAIRDFPWFDHTVAVVLYESVVTDEQSLNFFNMKTICGFECAPLPGSTLNPLARPSAVPDFLALEWLAVFNHTCPDAFPAYMNSAGASKQIAKVMKEGEEDTSEAIDSITAMNNAGTVIETKPLPKKIHAGNPAIVKPPQRRRHAPATKPEAPKPKSTNRGKGARSRTAPKNSSKLGGPNMKLNQAKQLSRKEQNIAIQLSNLLDKIKLGKK